MAGGRERPFMHVWRQALCEADLDATAKLVGFVIATWMRPDGTGAYPSRRSIGERASLGERAVDRAIKRLEDSGLVAVSHSKGRSSNTYTAQLTASLGTVSVKTRLIATGPFETANAVLSGRPTASLETPKESRSDKEVGRDPATTPTEVAGRRNTIADLEEQARDYIAMRADKFAPPLRSYRSLSAECKAKGIDPVLLEELDAVIARLGTRAA